MDSTSAVTSNFDNIPAKALNISSRLKLSWFLNPEQPLPSSDGIARDYRGLAELMDFEFNDIKNFQRSEDPTSKILEAWESRPNSTITDLIQFLEKMGRYDVIEDLADKFESDAKSYLKRKLTLKEIPVQVPEVTSCRAVENHFDEVPNMLTVHDIQTGEITKYDSYVCYADEDMNFVQELASRLEAPEVGLKLFIRSRDLLLGTSEAEADLQIIAERCNRMLIILTPDFLKSPSCEFQASFAAGLAIEQRRRKLIPIVLAQCEIPLILKFVSKIDLSKPEIQPYMWIKLISSICGCKKKCVSPINDYMLEDKKQLPQLESSTADTSRPCITFPPTLNFPSILYSDNSADSSGICSSVVISDVLDIEPTKIVISDVPDVEPTKLIAAKPTPPPKQRWYQKGFRQFASRNSSVSSSASSATSGFHSQSSNDFDSMDITDGSTNTTPL